MKSSPHKNSPNSRRGRLPTFKEYLGEPKTILVEIPHEIEAELLLEKRHTVEVNGVEVGVDSPHFPGDEKHGHVKLGGYEVTFTAKGERRHPNKFPAHVPERCKDAIAKALDVDPKLLEAYLVKGEGKEYLLVEVAKP